MIGYTEPATHTRTDVIATVAEFVFPGGSRSPEIHLSFDGSAPPRELLAELEAVGWSTQAVPPPPSNAIQWVPDPVTGNDYTITSWQVDEFYLTPNDDWANGRYERVGGPTVRCLHDHGTQIRGIRNERAQEQGTSGEPANAPYETVVSAGTLVILQPLHSNWVWPDGFTSTVATKGDKTLGKWMWSQGQGHDDSLEMANRSHEARSYRVPSNVDVQSAANHTTIQVMSMAGPLDDQRVRLLETMLGAAATRQELVAADGGVNAALYVASVPDNTASTAQAGINATLADLIVLLPSR